MSIIALALGFNLEVVASILPLGSGFRQVLVKGVPLD